MNTNSAWILVGPTAIGKTAVAQHVAASSGSTILSADAMLVYRGMDIGTAKLPPAERGQVRYLGIDLVEPDQPFNVGAWLARVRKQCACAVVGATPVQPRETSGIPAADDLLVVGGTGLYIRALTAGLDATAADPAQRRYWQERLAREGLDVLRDELARRAPEIAASMADPDNPRRIIRALEHLEAHGTLPVNWRGIPRSRVVGIRLPRPALHARIAARVEQMFAHGLIDEVASLRARFPSWELNSASNEERAEDPDTWQPVATARHAIGYAEACDLLDGKLTETQAKAQIVTRTRQLAKRQETWFRHQADVTWVDITPDESTASIAARVVAAWKEQGPAPICLT